MRTAANPFTDPSAVRGPLYASADRIASGPVPCTVPGSADGTLPTSSPISPRRGRPGDLPSSPTSGCGRGTTTLTLADRFPRARIAAIDLSAALLTAARNRTGSSRGEQRRSARTFTGFPSPDRACDLVVAAFCLYHSPITRPASSPKSPAACTR